MEISLTESQQQEATDGGQKLSDAVLKMEVSEQFILEIYSEVIDWQLVASHLKLTRAEIEAIDKNNQTEVLKRMRMLQEWRGKMLISGEATYGNLIMALVKGRCGDLAHKIRKLLKGGQN